MSSIFLFFFFFQAEDGIRDKLVTGVQTCALPISRGARSYLRPPDPDGHHHVHPAEDAADRRRPPPGEDDARHAVRLHVYVSEPSVRARPLLDGVEYPTDRPAMVDEPPGARARWARGQRRSEEHTSELQSLAYLVCRLLLEKKKKTTQKHAS